MYMCESNNCITIPVFKMNRKQTQVQQTRKHTHAHTRAQMLNVRFVVNNSGLYDR